jgi:hypothetical protein
MTRSLKGIFALVIVLFVHGVCLASGDVPASLSKWSTGKRIEVTLKTDEKVVGHLGAVDADGFVLEPDKRMGAKRVFQFTDVRSVRGKMTTARKWAIAGGVYGAVTIVSLVLGK